MKKVTLGATGISVSLLGIGTGTADRLGRCCQALMSEEALARLLLYAYERGVTFWDTALMYDTHRHVRRALRGVGRDCVVLTTKLAAASEKQAEKELLRALKELDVSSVDICCLHGVRNAIDFAGRHGALNALVKLKKRGLIRAIGLSSHGIEALEAAAQTPEIEVVWARINYAGLVMDNRALGLYDRIASVAWAKKLVKMLPRGLIAPVRTTMTARPVSARDRGEVTGLLQSLHRAGKGVVGMKVFAEGRLSHDAARALAYVNDLPFIDSCVVGMLTEKEIDGNCRMINGS